MNPVKKKEVTSIIRSLRNKTFYTLKSEGVSMLPFLRPGDVIVYRKMSFSKLKLNDIVVVSRRTYTFAHRIIYKGNRYIITKGDNNTESDGKTHQSSIIGKVVKVKRNGISFQFKDIYLMQSSLYLPELQRIVNFFQKNHIDYLVLKGLPLHLYYEKNLPNRVYADCDILISPEQFELVSEVMRKAGYGEMYTSMTPVSVLRNGPPPELSFTKKVNGFPVIFDIHTEPVFMMTKIAKINEFYSHKKIEEMGKEFLKNKRYLQISGINIPILSPEHLIIYLALHFFHHNFRGVFRLDLLKEVLTREMSQVGESALLKKELVFINRYSLARFVYPVFQILHYWFPSIRGVNLFLKNIASYCPEATRFQFKMTEVFNDENRIDAGIGRFLMLFKMSPRPLYHRLFVLFNIEVLYVAFALLIGAGINKVIRYFKPFSSKKTTARSFHF